MHGSEGALLDALVGAVRALDPDVLVGSDVVLGFYGFRIQGLAGVRELDLDVLAGFEVQQGSLGYLRSVPGFRVHDLGFFVRTSKWVGGVPCAPQVEVHGSEGALLDALVAAVRALDPDVLVGFEVQQGSLGYLSDRAATLARPEPLLRQLSRTPQVPMASPRAPCPTVNPLPV